MIKIASRIDSDNRISLPDEVRRALHVGAGEAIVFVIDEERRTVAVDPPGMTIEDTIGSLPFRPNMSDDFDIEIEEAVAEAMERKIERLSRQ